MRLLITFVRKYPFHTAIVLFALLLAGIAEGFGLSTMLPLLAAIAGGDLGGNSAASGGHTGNDSNLIRYVTEALGTLGLTPTVGVLLAVMVIAIVLKSIFMLWGNKRVGYTVAHVATDLRLSLLRAFLGTRWEYYLEQSVGALANAFATEAMRASQAYLCGARMAALFVQAIVYGAVALLVSWKATLASAV
ncbi:MAG: ABC transporter ATP-binding protein, partial [Deltaproteobacteria bacterium]